MEFLRVSHMTSELLPIEELAQDLNLSSDETGAVRQDALLEICLDAALQFVEAEIHEPLLARFYKASGQAQFPLGLPFAYDPLLKLVRVRENGEEISTHSWKIEPFDHVSRLVAPVDQMENLEIEISVGHSAWEDVPSDLRLLILRVAAGFYQDRDDQGAVIPQQLQAILERYKPVRLGRGG